MKPVTIVPVMLLALVLLSCGQVPTVPAPNVNPTAVPPTLAWPAEAQPLVDLARAELAKVVATTDIEVVKVEAVQWRNGCLECAKEGEMCTDAIVPGYRIVLRAAGVEFEYRSDGKQTVRPCPAATSAADWGAAQPWVQKAVADLMARLAVPVTAVKVVSVDQKMWPDSSIGCPKPGQGYLTVIVPGYQIILEASGKKFDYHADDKGTVFLCEQAVP
jgi:hypothetical protein